MREKMMAALRKSGVGKFEKMWSGFKKAEYDHRQSNRREK